MIAPDQGAQSGVDKSVEGIFPPFDPTYFASQLFWLAISFGLLYFVLSRFVLPQINGVLEQRKNAITNSLDTAARDSAMANETMTAYESMVSETQTTASKIALAARAEAEIDIKEAMARADQDLAVKLTESEARIASLRAQAISEVNLVAADVTSSVVKRLVDRVLGPDEARNIVEKMRS